MEFSVISVHEHELDERVFPLYPYKVNVGTFMIDINRYSSWLSENLGDDALIPSNKIGNYYFIPTRKYTFWYITCPYHPTFFFKLEEDAVFFKLIT